VSQNSKTLRAKFKAILWPGAKMNCSVIPGGEEGDTMNISNGWPLFVSLLEYQGI